MIYFKVAALMNVPLESISQKQSFLAGIQSKNYSRLCFWYIFHQNPTLYPFPGGGGAHPNKPSTGRAVFQGIIFQHKFLNGV